MTDSSSWKSTLNNEPLCFTGHQLFDAPETGASRATSHCLAIISQARSFKRMISMQMSGSKRTGGRAAANSRPINYVFISLPAKAASNPTPCLRGNARNRASLRKRRSFFCLRAICTRDSSLNRIRPDLTACATPSAQFRWNAETTMLRIDLFFPSPTIKSSQVEFGYNIIFVNFSKRDKMRERIKISRPI